jgi:hypothetical protein
MRAKRQLLLSNDTELRAAIAAARNFEDSNKSRIQPV